jgi:hypothetical protein
MPDSNAIVNAFLREVARFVDYETAPQVERLEKEIQKSGGTPSAHNKLGILYAQYGKLDQAEAEFKKATAQKRYVPGLLNTSGTCTFLKASGGRRKSSTSGRYTLSLKIHWFCLHYLVRIT